MVDIEVSIIIPAYNAEKTIYLCLNSILESNYPMEKLEVIVVDNNSTDETGLIVDQLDVVKILEKKQGRSIARNTGIKAARGKYIGFLDSDVAVEKDWIAQMVAVLKKGQIGGVAGQTKPGRIYGQSFLNKYRHWIISRSTLKTWNILKLKIRESPMINSAACMYRKEALELVEGFDERLERHEDIDLSKRVLYAGYDLSVADKAIVNVEYHGEGWLSYFERSFQDGLKKSDYLKKWGSEIELVGPEEDTISLGTEDVSNRPSTNLYDSEYEESKLSRKVKEKAYKSVYIFYVIREFVWDFYSLVRFQDRYHGIKMINDVLRILGRVVGFFQPNIFDKKLILNLRPKADRYREVEFGAGNSFPIHDYIRFVLLSDNYYLIDVRDHLILENRAKAHVMYHVWQMLFKEFDFDFSDPRHSRLFTEQDILDVPTGEASE